MRTFLPSARPPGRRRSRLAVSLLAVPLALMTACGGGQADGAAALADGRPARPPCPTAPDVVGDPATQVALELSGQLDKVSTFEIEWANISGGPQTIEAFRGDALDIGAVADIPPIHATWTGTARKIVAVEVPPGPDQPPHLRARASRPAWTCKTLADLRGQEDRLQPRPGPGRARAAGAEEGRADQGGRQAGRAAEHRRRLRRTRWPPSRSTSPRSAASQIKRYLAKYGKDGATTIAHGLRDDAGHLYVPTRVAARTRPRRPRSASTSPRGRVAQVDRRAPRGVDRGVLRRRTRG